MKATKQREKNNIMNRSINAKTQVWQRIKQHQSKSIIMAGGKGITTEKGIKPGEELYHQK